MSKKQRRTHSVEVPPIGEPLENPNFVTPTALTDPRSYGTEPFPYVPPVPDESDGLGEDLFPAPGVFPERTDR